jgi:RNA recognition motif-containing protein
MSASSTKKEQPQSNELKLMMQAKSASHATERKHQIKVSGLTWAADEAMLREMFEDVGNITHIAVPKDKLSGHCRGFAFVSFTDANAVRAAIDNFNDQGKRKRHVQLFFPDYVCRCGRYAFACRTCRAARERRPCARPLVSTHQRARHERSERTPRTKKERQETACCAILILLMAAVKN